MSLLKSACTVARSGTFSLAFLLVACGGGGGGGSASAPAAELIPQGELVIGGTLSVAAALTVDVDTNDPDAPPYNGPDNDLPYDDIDAQSTLRFSGQPLPNPGSAGGFSGFAGKSASGPANDTGDLHDFYRVALFPGQTVSLVISDHVASDPTRNDLDLLLLDLDGNLVDFAAGFGLGDGFGAFGEVGHFKNPHRTVPENGFCILQRC